MSDTDEYEDDIELDSNLGRFVEMVSLMKKKNTLYPDCPYYRTEIKPWVESIIDSFKTKFDILKCKIIHLEENTYDKCFLCGKTKKCIYEIITDDNDEFRPVGSYCGSVFIPLRAVFMYLDKLKSTDIVELSESDQIVLENLTSSLAKAIRP